MHINFAFYALVLIFAGETDKAQDAKTRAHLLQRAGIRCADTGLNLPSARQSANAKSWSLVEPYLKYGDC
jgi:hypothetical protein